MWRSAMVVLRGEGGHVPLIPSGVQVEGMRTPFQDSRLDLGRHIVIVIVIVIEVGIETDCLKGIEILIMGLKGNERF
jgi:hypothetical protein